MITYYTQSGCGSCVATKRTLDKLGLDYETVDATDNNEVREELRQMGVSQMPVVVSGTTIISGYRPDELKKLAL